MITQYGMSEKFGLMGLASVEHEYLNGRATPNCGDATATEIDHEVMKMLKRVYEQAKQMLCEQENTGRIQPVSPDPTLDDHQKNSWRFSMIK